MAHCNAQMTDYVPMTPPGIGQSVYVRNSDTTNSGVSTGDGCVSNGTYVACAYRQSWNALVVYNGDGDMVWGSRNLLDNHNFAGMPIMQADGSVLAGDDQHLYLFNSDGSVAWSTPSPGGVPVGLVPTPNGGIFTGTAPQQLYQCWQGNCTLNFTVNNGGHGYSTASVVLAGGFCPGAVATAAISGGAVTSVTATTQGPDCVVVPDVIIQGDGTGAAVAASFTAAAPLAVYDGNTGALVGSKYLYQSGSSGAYYATVNTACVNNGSYPNRVYLLTALTTNNAYGALWALDIDPTNLTNPISPAWSLSIHGPSGASPLCVGDRVYFDGAGVVPTDHVGTTVFGVQDNGTSGSFLFKVSLGASSQPITCNFAIDPRPEGGFWHVVRFDPNIYHRDFVTGKIIESVNVSDMLTAMGAPPTTYWQAGIFTEYGTPSQPYLMLPEAGHPQAGGYLAMLDVAAQQLVWAVPLAGNDLDPYDTPGGDAALVMDSSGNPVVVMNAKQSGAYFITNGGPVGVLSLHSLQFGSLLTGTSSAKQNVTFTNSSGGALTISSIHANLPFKQTNNCGSGVAPGASCTISVTFNPTSAGSQSGAVTVTTNAINSPHTVTLGGTGLSSPPAGMLSSTALTFPPQNFGTVSVPQSVTLSNIGTSALAITGFNVSGAAAQTNNCPTSLGPAASCSINAMVAAPLSGSCTGSVSVNTNAGGGAMSVSLAGSCTATPSVESALSISSLVYSPQPVGTVSASQSVTLKSIGTSNLNVASITAGGDVTQTNTCGATLRPGASCVIKVAFAPSVTGSRSGTVTVVDSAPDSPHVVSILGVGTANPVPLINLPLAPSSILPGTSGTSVTVSGTGFVPGSTVYWNGSPRTTTYVGGSQLSVSLTPADVSGPVTGSLSVVNPGPGGGQSNIGWLPVSYPNPVPVLDTTVFPAGANPSALAAADLNGDGKLDLAVTNLAANTVSVWMGNGDGTFAPSVDYPAGTQPQAVAIGDLNHDGIPDLVVADRADNTVSVLLGTGGGLFAPQTVYPTGNRPVALLIADVDGDGNVDLAVANAADNTVSILAGKGDGSFAANVDYPAGQNPSALVAGDFNGDGKPDLAVANDITPGGSVTVLLNHGDGTYLAGVAYSTADSVSLVTADFNGDGKLDLVAVNNLAQSLNVYLGNGDGTFTVGPSQAARLSPAPVAVAAGDVNGDGTLELVVASNADDSLVTLSVNSAVTFGQLLQYGSAPGAGAMVMGDFNNDGSLDVVVTMPATNNIAIMLQSPFAALSNTSLSFGNVAVGSTGTQALTITNSGSALLNMGSIGVTGNFSQTNTCTAPVPSGGSCTVTVTFSPAAAGTLTGTLTLTDNAAESPQTLALSGIGIAGGVTVGLSQSATLGGVSVASNTVTLSSAAPAGGTMVALSSSNPAVASVPASVTVAAGATVSAPFTVTTALVTSSTPVTISATASGSTGNAVLTVNPLGASFSLAGSSPYGGVTLTPNTISLAAAAPAGGLAINLTSSNPAVASVPSSVTVPGGATASPSFNIATNGVSSSTAVTITATLTGVTGAIATATLNVLPAVPGAVALSPSAVAGGLSTTANVVNLLGVAPAGGLTVALSSSKPLVAGVPPSVTVAEGSSVSAPFTITTALVANATAVTITATAAGSNATAVLTVNPNTVASIDPNSLSPAGGTNVAATVTLLAPAPSSGANVTLTSSNPAVALPPSYVRVGAGAITSAQFKISTSNVSVGTPVIITATYNGGSASVTITVYPLVPYTLNLSQTSAKGGKTITGTVVMNGTAPSGGITVSLSSTDSNAAPVPASVAVPAGSNVSSRFSFVTGTVTTSTTVTITATYQGYSATNTLTVNP
ncbi:MAG TPA: FG-GAP-like repeat-containing protein [Bryobacteraceae bacterium]|nr:FG-GAP-like repeat-containing protein [Bryobacteraceae bacterium]